MEEGKDQHVSNDSLRVYKLNHHNILAPIYLDAKEFSRQTLYSIINSECLLNNLESNLPSLRHRLF